MLRASILSTLQRVDRIINNNDTLVLWVINVMFALIIAGWFYPTMFIVVVPVFSTLVVLWCTIWVASLTRGM